MTANKVLLATVPGAIMLAATVLLPGVEHWLAAFGATAHAKMMLGRVGLALPYAAAGAIGVTALFAANGSANIRPAGWSVVAGSAAVVLVAATREATRLVGIAGSVPTGQSALAYVDPATAIGAAGVFLAGVFALRVAVKGNAAFAKPTPRRVHGARAIHGESVWMSLRDAAKLFPDYGGIVIG
ncbi:conjugal transfer protein TraG, partial [Mesorhizobium sp. M00.F.Ca.ET.149.01.1.1]